MKKSRTTMNVPARTTGRAGIRCARVRTRRPSAGAPRRSVCWLVLMADTVPAAGHGVDYPTGKRRARPPCRSAPDGLRGLDDEPQLRDLVVDRQRVPLDGG